MPTVELVTSATPAARSRPRLDWSAFNPFSDLRVRYGIKTGLAMILALWIAELYRLQYPNWAALAVLVLMSAQYVGATANKALMRALGTVVGAVLGVWVIGDYANTPWAFVFWVFVAVTIATYKFGQLASAAAPYAYFLGGMTLVSVSTYGLANPSDVWQIALSRTLETLVGVASATFVSATIWPRHAREEFIHQTREALKTVRLLLNAETRAYVGEAVDAGRVTDLRKVFSRQVFGLRALLLTGGRGSAYFRARLGNYQRFLVSLTYFFQAILEIQRRRAEEAELLELVRPELGRFMAAVDADLGELSTTGLASHPGPPAEVNGAFTALESKVRELRDQGTFRNASPAAGEAFFGHFSTLRMIRDELNLLRQISGELPRLRLRPRSRRKREPVLASIDWFWLRAGLKGAVSVCLAFLLLEWINPPGPTAIPLSAWIFSVFGRSFLNAGGTGDLRAIQKVLITAVVGLPVVAVVWLILPFLSNYWAMNAVLFVICYAFGYATARTQGVTFRMQVVILSINVLVALNPQEPVAFSSLMHSYLGLMTGMTLAVVVGRLLWPVLPQNLFRSNLIQYFADLQNLLQRPINQEFILSRTVLLPMEALRSVDSMDLPRCPPSERERLANFIRASQPLGMQLTVLQEVMARPLAPGVETRLREPLANLETGFAEFLARLAECLRRRTSRIDFPDLEAGFEAVESAITRIRDEGVLAHEDVQAVAHMLELADRYRTIVERLQLCRDRLQELRLNDYLRDVAL